MDIKKLIVIAHFVVLTILTLGLMVAVFLVDKTVEVNPVVTGLLGTVIGLFGKSFSSIVDYYFGDTEQSKTDRDQFTQAIQSIKQAA